MEHTDQTISTEAILNAEAEHTEATDCEPAASAEPAEPTLEQRLAEAERRGYLRGRNEALAERLERPALMVEPEPRREVDILADIRPSVWN